MGKWISGIFIVVGLAISLLTLFLLDTGSRYDSDHQSLVYTKIMSVVAGLILAATSAYLFDLIEKINKQSYYLKAIAMGTAKAELSDIIDQHSEDFTQEEWAWAQAYLKENQLPPKEEEQPESAIQPEAPTGKL